MLHKVIVRDFKNSAGRVQDIRFSYETFGPDLGKAPVVLVNHALSGNSSVTGAKGWWNSLVGPGKSIDTDRYTILAFNMPGNGYDEDPDNLLHNYKEFRLRDFAEIYARALDQLGLIKIYAGVGGSIGGSLLWELAALRPHLFENIIPVATDFKATQWLRALCKVQDSILNNSARPLHDARMHAMTFYRSPQSLHAKFVSPHLKPITGNIESWLEHHGRKLEERFQVAAYKLMNHLLTTTDISNGSGDHLSAAAAIEGNIHIITVNSDLFFLPGDNWDAYVNLSLIKPNIQINEIKSLHGHDAFLIENGQLTTILNPIFNTQYHNEKSQHSTLWSR